MKSHKTIHDITAKKASILQGNFLSKIEHTAFGFEGSLRVARSEMTVYTPDTVEYALMMTALASMGPHIFREHWAEMMHFIEQIRPPSTGGRFKLVEIPKQFGDLWPHQRLGHASWTAYVEAPRDGVWRGQQFEVPPGLGMTRQYEANLWRGWQTTRMLVATAMPDASPAEQNQKLNEVMRGTGPGNVVTLGKQKVSIDANLSQEKATAAVRSLSSGEVTQDAINHHGVVALFDPSKRKHTPDRIDVARKALQKLSQDERIELFAEFGLTSQQAKTQKA